MGAVDESWDTDRPLEASDEGVPQMRLDVGDAAEKVRVRGCGASTRRVIANFWQMFGKMLLVFGGIGADFCK